MHLKRRSVKLLAVLLGLSLFAAACGDDDDKGSGSSDEGQTQSTRSNLGQVDCGELVNDDAPDGGEFVDYAQLSDRGSNTTFDPGSVQTLDEGQITQALFDSLTDFDFSEKCAAELKPDVAESYESNDDASVWTFKIKKGLKFSNGEPILPSNFKLAWERNGSKELASPYGYLINYVKGGKTLQDGTATTLDSIVADDEAMTLEVTLEAPNADFDGIVSFVFFSPITQAELTSIGNKTGWGTAGVTIGNGPFMLESASLDEVVMVPNPNWDGNVYGDEKPHLDKITIKLTDSVEAAFQAFESGEGHTATIPSGRYADAQANYPNTVDSPTLGTYYFDIGSEDPQLSGDANVKLRQAISQAIDRDEINLKAYEGARTVSGGITPAGIPGYKPDICKYCKFDKVAAKKAFDEWTAGGGKLTRPIQIEFNAGGSHADVSAIIQANLKDNLGIDTELNPIAERYFRVIAEPGACQICRHGWYADYPTYGNFTVDLYGKGSIGLNNIGRFDDPKFEQMIADAQAETDDAKRAELYQEAEAYILNVKVASIPLNFYQGDQVYRDTVVNYDQPPLGYIMWERIGLKG